MSSSPVPQSNNDNNSQAENPTLDKLRPFMNQAAMRELIDNFIVRAGTHIRKAQQSVQDKDVDKLKMALHTLKGSSANLGLDALSQLCAETESSFGTASDWEQVKENLNTILSHYQQGCDALRQYLASHY